MQRCLYPLGHCPIPCCTLEHRFFSHLQFFFHISCKFPEALSLLAILTSVMVHFNISTGFSYILVFSSILCFKTLSRCQSCILLMLSQLPPVYYSFSVLFLLVFLKITDYVGFFLFFWVILLFECFACVYDCTMCVHWR